MLSIVANTLSGKLFFWNKTLTHYHHRTMSMWVQYEKSIAAWLHHISNKFIQAPRKSPLLTLNHTHTLEASTCPTKNNCSSKNCTQLDSLPLEHLHDSDMWHAGIVHYKKLNPVLVRLTQHHPVLRASLSYKLKQSPFDYFMHMTKSNSCGWAYSLDLINTAINR